MPDRENVEQGIKACWSEYFFHKCCDCPYMSDRNDRKCIERLGADAIALLKEQEAVDARKENDGVPQPWTSWWYVCGDCGQEIDYHDRFCRWCGRSVKWE